MRFCALLVLVPLLATPALSQEPPVFELPEVTIPGRRPQTGGSTPASVTVITRAELERLGARTVADALRLVPEALVRAYGGYGALAEPSIRGFGPGQVLVLLDGVPVNNVALGQADLSTVSLLGVERIEVLRGAFGAISGSGAVGGVINIVTAGGTAPTVRMRAGPFGEHHLHAGTGGRAASLAFEASGTDGFRPNSDVAAVTVVGHLTLGSGIRLTAHHTRMELGTPGDVAFPTPQDRQSVVRTIVQSQWGDPAGPARGRLYAVAESLGFSSPTGNSTYATWAVGGELQREWPVAPGRVLAGGLELQRQNLDAVVFGSAVLRETVVGAAYLEFDAALSSRLLVSTAVRVDGHSAYGATVNPRVGVVVAIDDATRLRAGIGRTFRGPTFLQLYFPGCSDPALRPETAWTVETSLEREWGSRTGTLTAFLSEATDLISGGCPPQNIGSASIVGLSADLRGVVGGGWTGRMNLTVQQAIDRITGDALPRVPWVIARAALTHDLSDASAISVIAEYIGPRIDRDFSVFPAAAVQMPGYVELALRYQRQMASGWMIVAGADNLLDVSYEAVKGYPAPGRTFFLTASKSY
ncbi:MAG: hypothetical protein A2V59_09180 [Armatimonadetes bacterium RBG_19FT_COMBO_69_19]|nr:MAG: hypothetical protein A2V59_09180 [Armatimonadetes bacterium RBG_19FT_COMBO_69_19]